MLLRGEKKRHGNIMHGKGKGQRRVKNSTSVPNVFQVKLSRLRVSRAQRSAQNINKSTARQLIVTLEHINNGRNRRDTRPCWHWCCLRLLQALQLRPSTFQPVHPPRRICKLPRPSSTSPTHTTSSSPNTVPKAAGPSSPAPPTASAKNTPSSSPPANTTSS